MRQARHMQPRRTMAMACCDVNDRRLRPAACPHPVGAGLQGRLTAHALSSRDWTARAPMLLATFTCGRRHATRRAAPIQVGVKAVPRARGPATSTILRADTTELDLNNAQLTACKRHAGAARFAYHWGLEQAGALPGDGKKSLSDGPAPRAQCPQADRVALAVSGVDVCAPRRRCAISTMPSAISSAAVT